METARFDALSRTLSKGLTRRGALAVLGGLAALRLSEASGKRRGRGDKARRRGNGHLDVATDSRKVTICHRTRSRKNPFQVIEVPQSAVTAHEAHGDLVRCDDLNVIDIGTCTCLCPPEAATQCQADEILDPGLCRCGPRPVPVCAPACSAEERCREVTIVFGGGPTGPTEITYTTCCQYQSGAEVLACSGQPLPGGYPPTESGTATFICTETCPVPPNMPGGGATPFQIDRVACEQTCAVANAPCGQGGTCVVSQCCNGLICKPACDKSRFA